MAKGICSVVGCGRPHYARGWCDPHYERLKKTGDVRPDVPIGQRQPRKGKCSVETCERPVRSVGLCGAHYRRLEVSGGLRPDVPIRGPRGTCSIEGCTAKTMGYGWCQRHYEIFQRYGMTPLEYLAILEGQGGGCAICGAPEPTWARLAIDHDHQCCNDRKKRSCGKCNRGLLCSLCNNLLGQAKDDPATLRAAIGYLAKWGISEAQPKPASSSAARHARRC